MAITKEEFDREVEMLLISLDVDIKTSGVDLTNYWTGHEDNRVPIQKSTAIRALGLFDALRTMKGSKT